MVVDVALDAGADDARDAQQQRTTKKYLVAHSQEQMNSIVDYVHLSSSLLRKVRFGQPVELAIQTQTHAKASNTHKLTRFDSLSLPSREANYALHSLPHQRVRQSATALAQSSKYAAPSLTSGTSIPVANQQFIRYNRVVRFQAADGGYLLVESDGCLRKVSAECAGDPRTLVAIFPRDPVANLANQPKRIRSMDCAFLVQGDRASLHSKRSVARADSDEMVEGPAHLVDDVMHHDNSAAQRASFTSQSRKNEFRTSPPKLLTKQDIRKQQLKQTRSPETDAMPTTVWCLVKVATRAATHGGAEALAQSPCDTYFRHGNQCQIFQNQAVVCYERKATRSSRFSACTATGRTQIGGASTTRSVGSTSKSPPLSEPTTAGGSSGVSRSTRTAASEVSGQSVSPTRVLAKKTGTTFAHVWLHDAPRLGVAYHPTNCCCDASRLTWDNTWRICDVDVVQDSSSSDLAARTALPALTHANTTRRPSAAAAATESIECTTHAPSPDSMLVAVNEDEYDGYDSDESFSGDDSSSSSNDHTDDRAPLPMERLQRQTSVYDIAKFAIKAETRQARAASIIVRFFQRLLRDEATRSRVQDFVRRRRRVSHTERHIPTTELSTNEQLALLQCYNPHVYGIGDSPALRLRHEPSSSTQQRARRDVSFRTFMDRADVDRQRLATIQSGVDTLHRDWFGTEHLALRTLQTPSRGRLHSSSSSLDAYSRRSLTSPITPQRVVANRERERRFVVDMKMAKRDAPTFHFGTNSSTNTRPCTASLDPLL